MALPTLLSRPERNIFEGESIVSDQFTMDTGDWTLNGFQITGGTLNNIADVTAGTFITAEQPVQILTTGTYILTAQAGSLVGPYSAFSEMLWVRIKQGAVVILELAWTSSEDNQELTVSGELEEGEYTLEVEAGDIDEVDDVTLVQLTSVSLDLTPIYSYWNAAALPLQYAIENTKWPDNQESTATTILSAVTDNGYSRFAVTTGIAFFPVGSIVQITNSDYYNGIWEVIEVNAPNLITVNVPFVATEAGPAMEIYFRNYTTIVNIYAGLPADHEFYSEKPIVLVGTVEQRPNSDNITYVDVRKYVLSKLNTNNDITQDSWECDLNLFTGFYIEWAERYDVITGGEVENFTSAYTSDEDTICWASHSALQFRNPTGGNMQAYILDGYAFREVKPKFMTQFERPKIFEGYYFDLAMINIGFEFVYITEYDKNGTELNQQNIQVEGTINDGVFRFRLDNLTFDPDTSYITVQIAATGEESALLDSDLEFMTDSDLVLMADLVA